MGKFGFDWYLIILLIQIWEVQNLLFFSIKVFKLVLFNKSNYKYLLLWYGLESRKAGLENKYIALNTEMRNRQNRSFGNVGAEYILTENIFDCGA